MNPFELTVTQKSRCPDPARIDAVQYWIVIYANPDKRSTGEAFHWRDLIHARRMRTTMAQEDTSVHVTDLPTETGARVASACIKPDLSSFELLTLARKLVAVQVEAGTDRIGVHIGGYTERQAVRIAEAVVAAAAAASVAMPSYKKAGDKPRARPRQLEIYGVLSRDGYRRTLAEAEGNALCRQLSMMPPNRLTPTEYLAEIRGLARKHQWKLEFMDIAALERRKAGAFLAVVQGSPVPDAGIVRLRYTPARGATRPALALVGKGLCYDTGGTNLKPAKFMFGMHEDMQGSAVALGTLLALTRLKVNYPVECWLALAMNHIGPKAYKPNDVVTAANGTSIEVVHTDAEGRMVLADTLHFAASAKPGLIVDYATLTGACVYSLGSAYSGVFTNRPALFQELIRAGVDSGERVWPFPLDEDYDQALKSEVADVRQCALEGEADHILAARFLGRFAGDEVPWIHIDLSASRHKGGLGHVPTDTTGFGIRYTLNLLEHGKVLKH